MRAAAARFTEVVRGSRVLVDLKSRACGIYEARPRRGGMLGKWRPTIAAQHSNRRHSHDAERRRRLVRKAGDAERMTSSTAENLGSSR